jgi:hypothetical protein
LGSILKSEFTYFEEKIKRRQERNKTGSAEGKEIIYCYDTLFGV